MTKTTKKFVPNAGQLSPVVCKDETEAMNIALDGIRRRPVVAINQDGNLVVCCRSTAKRNEWEVQGKLYQRDRSKQTDVKARTPARRSYDAKGSDAFVAVTNDMMADKTKDEAKAAKTKVAKQLLEVAVNEILGASKIL